MDTMTMDFRKIQLAQFILGLSDTSLLDKISQLVGPYTQGAMEPCHYTLEEVQDRLRVCEEDAIAGFGTAQDDVESESLSWI